MVVHELPLLTLFELFHFLGLLNEEVYRLYCVIACLFL